MLLEKTDQMFAGNASVLGSGDPITAQTSGIEPFTDGAGRNFTDLSYLTSSKDRPHGGLSNQILIANTEGSSVPSPLLPQTRWLALLAHGSLTYRPSSSLGSGLWLPKKLPNFQVSDAPPPSRADNRIPRSRAVTQHARLREWNDLNRAQSRAVQSPSGFTRRARVRSPLPPQAVMRETTRCRLHPCNPSNRPSQPIRHLASDLYIRPALYSDFRIFDQRTYGDRCRHSAWPDSRSDPALPGVRQFLMNQAVTVRPTRAFAAIGINGGWFPPGPLGAQSISASFQDLATATKAPSGFSSRRIARRTPSPRLELPVFQHFLEPDRHPFGDARLLHRHTV